MAGKTPRLIDEWQLAPALWDAVRFEVDHRDGLGQFILTGSAVPPDTRQISHTGTGRIARLHMRTMSLFESGDSNGGVRLGELFANPSQIYGVNELSINDIAYLICRGGWPIASMQKRSIALERAFDYYNAIVKVDISRVDEVKRNPERAKRLMRSYARHQGSQASLATIGDDVRANDGGSLADNTLYDYLKSLAEKIDTDKMKAPAFKMVLTGVGRYAFRREDGIYIIPIGCLRD